MPLSQQFVKPKCEHGDEGARQIPFSIQAPLTPQRPVSLHMPEQQATPASPQDSPDGRQFAPMGWAQWPPVH